MSYLLSTKFYIAKIKADSKKIDFSFLEYNEEQKKIGYKFFENDIVLNKRNEKLSFILSALNAIILYYIKHKKEYNYLLTKVVKKYREKFGIDKISFKKYGLLFFEIDNIKNIKEIVCYHSIMEIFKDTPFFDVIKNMSLSEFILITNLFANRKIIPVSFFKNKETIHYVSSIIKYAIESEDVYLIVLKPTKEKENKLKTMNIELYEINKTKSLKEFSAKYL